MSAITQPLDEFLKATDPNAWWRQEAGDQLNLFEEAVGRMEAAEAAIARVRRLCELTINTSCRVQAIDQAQDTLAALDRTNSTPPDRHRFERSGEAGTRTLCTCGLGLGNPVHIDNDGMDGGESNG